MNDISMIGSHQQRRAFRKPAPSMHSLETKTESDPRVAIVHDWTPVVAGGEKVLKEMITSYPNSEIYTLFNFLSEKDRNYLFGENRVYTSSLNKLPGVRHYYRHLLLPATRAIEAFNLENYELVISSSAAISKGIITSPEQTHIAYVHSPARYAWDLTHEYLDTLKGPFHAIKRTVAHEMLHRFRIWDMRTAAGVDHFVANSDFIKRRIWKIYKRDATIIYPPVDVEAFHVRSGGADDYYFTASRMVPYKRVDLIVEAFNRRPKLRLAIAGDGPDLNKIRKIAGPNIVLLGRVSEEDLVKRMRECRAFVFAAKEDFGITLVEAQACGAPVIALGVGGTAETVRDVQTAEPTGILFKDQSINSLLEAIDKMEVVHKQISAQSCRQNAERFGAARFRHELTEYVRGCVR